MIARRLFAAAILACSFGLSASAASATTSPPAGPSELGGANAARVFANCTALNKTYRHGVARKGARDRVSGASRPVTNFAVDAAVYNANTKSDRDKDGIACEKR
jgi:excalibur calcium-binding domain-containing protein